MSRDLLTGKVLIAMDNLPAYLAHIRSGALRALGVTSARRCECVPNVASIAEQGYPDYEATLWWYVAMPAGARLALLKRISDAIVNGLAAERALRKLGVAERPGNADELARHIAAERTKWQRVIQFTGLEAR